MTRAWALGVVAACAGAPPPQVSGADSSEAAALDALADAFWDANMRRYPRWATSVGDRRFDALLEDLHPEAFERFREELLALKQRVEGINAHHLDTERRITQRVLLEELGRTLELDVCQQETHDVDQLYGLQISLFEISRTQRLDSEAAGRAFVARLAAVPSLMQAHIANLRRGLANGRVPYRRAVERVIDQLDGIVATEPQRSPFVAAVEGAESLPPEIAKSLRDEVEGVVQRDLQPAFAAYRSFLVDELLSKARTKPGIDGLPDGPACYRASIAYYTSTRRSPGEIHRLGLEELERLQTAMNDLAKSEGHADWRQYLAVLESSKAQYLATPAEIVAHSEALVQRASAALPAVFGRLPKTPVRVTPIESYRHAAAPAAYYYPAPDDQSRPATYYINTHDPEKRPLFNMEALAFHEAVPGHHLQIAIAQELEGLPAVRRHARFTAFVEGWALYAELVADELGLYSSPATKLGMYNYQAWRAARLVVDTGLHAMGWSREQAIDFMKEHLALPQVEIENEVDRYIIWPGQALAYMLGRMHIQELRAQVQARRGAQFDLAAFHDEVLGHGALPLNVLTEAVLEREAPLESAAR